GLCERPVGPLPALRRRKAVRRLPAHRAALRVVRARLFVRRFRRRPGDLRDVHRGRHRGRPRARRPDRLPAALLAARGAVAAADPAGDACAAAPPQGAADRAAIPPRRRRRPARTAGARMTAARPAWRGLVIPSVFAAAALAVLLGLGTWQVERRAWKEALIGEITQRLAAAPGELPSPASWPTLDPAGAEFRRVRFRAELLHDREAFVHTSGSALRSDASGIGYWVFTPARLPGGELILVNRGFVPEARRDPATRAAGNLSGPVEIIGAIRAPERPGWFTP